MSGNAKAAPCARARPWAWGSSLIELLIVIAIIGVITTGMYAFFLSTSQTYSDQAVNARMLWQATTAMERITQDLRQTGMFLAPACAAIMPAPVAATANPAGTVGIVTLLDDPAVRTEIATVPVTGQLNTNNPIGVLSIGGPSPLPSFQVNDVAFITDGVQCTKFTVTAVVTGANPGLQHNSASDANTFAGTYRYPVATSMVYKVKTNQTITYALDTSDPKTTWLTKDEGSGPKRLMPDVESLSFSFLDGSGNAVNPAINAANVRAVTVSLRVKADTKDPLLGDFRRQTLTSTVQLRNLGS